MFNTLFKTKTDENAQAAMIYTQIMTRIEQPDFYKKFGLEQNLDTVMQALFLHLCMVMIVLKHAGNREAQSQAIFDYCFKAIEISYMEAGAGDYSIGHKMKKALKFFYGSLAVYENAVLESSNAALEDALQKNMYIKQIATPEQLTLLGQETYDMLQNLKKIDWDKSTQTYFSPHFT